MGLFVDDGLTLSNAISSTYLKNESSDIYENIPEALINYFTGTFSQKVERYKSSGFGSINTSKKLEQIFSVLDDLTLLHTLQWLIKNNYLEVLQNKKEAILDTANSSEFDKELSDFCEKKWSDFFSSFKKSIPINITKAINTVDLEKQSRAKQIIFFDSSDNKGIEITKTLLIQAVKLSENPEQLTVDEHETSSNLEQGLSQKKAIGLVGAFCLFIGVLTPILSVPFLGTLTLLNNDTEIAYTIMCLALLSVIVVLTNKNEGVWYSGIMSSLLILFAFTRYTSKLAEMKLNMNAQLDGNPFRWLTDAVMQSVQLQWGWGILFLGAILIVTCAAIKNN
jgi:hypothetical protein